MIQKLTLLLIINTSLLFSLQYGYCQYVFNVEHMSIRNVIISWPDTIFKDDFDYGPELYVDFSLKNCSNDTIVLHYNDINITSIYYYHFKEYRREFNPFKEWDSIKISPGHCVIIRSFGWLILGTDFFPKKRHKCGRMIINCSKEIRELFPTIQFEMIFNNEKLIAKSVPIKKLSLDEYYHQINY